MTPDLMTRAASSAPTAWEDKYFMAMTILLILFIVFAILTIVIQKQFQKKNEIHALKQSSSQKTGAQVAQMILDKNGISNVRVVLGQEGGDHYNSQTKTIALSPSVFNSSSVSANAIAAHECGHAIQDHKGERMLSLRNSLAPAVGIATQIGSMMFQIGWILWLFTWGMSTSIFFWFTMGGLIMYAAMGIFQFITLPVEFGASRKAKKELAALGIMVTESDKQGTKSVLNAAAMTYVIAFLTTAVILAMFVLRFLAMSRR